MLPMLKKQRVDDHRTAGREGNQARNHVLGAVQEDAHRKAALRGPATAAARRFVIISDLLRHFSSPEGADPARSRARAAAALRYCSTVAASPVWGRQVA